MLTAVLWYVSRHASDMGAAVNQLRSVRPSTLGLAMVAMVGVMVANGAVHRRALGCVGVPIPEWRAARLAAASHSINVVAPSAGLASFPLFMRAARQVERPAGAGIAGYLVASLVGRAALVVTGLVVLPVFVHSSLGLLLPTAAVVAYAGITAAKVSAAVAVSRRPESVERLMSRLRRSSARSRPDGAPWFEESVAMPMRGLWTEPRALAPALGWSLIGKAAGGVSVWIAVSAVGGTIPPGQAFAAFSLATTAGALSFVPGGVGVVDAALAGCLGRFGLPLVTAAAATIVYRLFQLWVPLLLGALGATALNGTNARTIELPALSRLIDA